MRSRPGRVLTATLAIVVALAGAWIPASAATGAAADAAAPVGGVLAGRLTDATGGPVAGTWVTAMTADVTSAYSVRTDDAGRYRVTGVTPGDYYVSFMVPGTLLVQYLPGKALSREGVPYRVAAGAETVADDVVLPLGAIVGHFTDGAGGPVSARVNAIPADQHSGYASGGTAATDGGYTVVVFAGSYLVRFSYGSFAGQYAYRQLDPARAAVVEVGPGERVTVDDTALPV